MSYFLDTNMCIYFLKGTYPQILSKMLSFHPSKIKIPAVVKAELIYGAEKSAKRDENIEKVSAFLLPFEIVPFNGDAAVIYGEIRAELERAGTPIGPNDLLIAASVLAENGVLVTNNMKEYRRVPGLRLENWAESGLK